MLIQAPSQRPRYLERESLPAAGEEAEFPTLLGCRSQTCCARIIIVRKRLLCRSPATLELHQALVVARGSAKIKPLIAVRTAPRDRFPQEQIVGGEMEIAFIGRAIGISKSRARCKQDHTGDNPSLVFRQQQLHCTARRKSLPQLREKQEWLRWHPMFLPARLKMKVVEMLYISKVLRKADLHAMPL